MRDAKIGTIYEGTTGIQAMDLLGRKVAMKSGALFMNFMGLLNDFVEKHKDHPELGSHLILLGEAKWIREPVSRSIVRKLVSKTESVVPDDGEGWTVHYAFFARTRFTDAATEEAQRHGALLVDLEMLGKDLDAIRFR